MRGLGRTPAANVFTECPGVKRPFVDVESKHVYNVLPYLGGYEKESRNGIRLADNTVLRLMQELLDKGYNVTTDNFFTSPDLANTLKKRRTTTVGTVRANRLHLPKDLGKKPSHSMKVHFIGIT